MTAFLDRCRDRTSVRTWLLIGALLSPLAVLAPLPSAAPTHVQLPWLVLTAAFGAGALLQMHFEYREESMTFSLSEAALAAALFLAGPWELVSAAVVGWCLDLLCQPRQPVQKAAFNLAVVVAECSVALLVHRTVFGAPALDEPLGWLAGAVAVLAGVLVSLLAVLLVIRWHGGRPRMLALVRVAAVSSIAMASTGLAAGLLLLVHPAAVVLLGIVAAVLFSVLRAWAALQQRYASLSLLHDFSGALGTAVAPADIATATLRYARELLRSDLAELAVLGATPEQDLRLRLRGDGVAEHVPVGELRGELAALASREEALLVARGDSTNADTAYVRALDVRDAVVVPVRIGNALAVFAVGDRLADVSTFDDADVRLFSTLSRHAELALEKGRLIDRLREEARRREHQALHDDLTGLPNRVAFREQAVQMLSAGGGMTVVLLDLNEFKDVNDTLGHSTGDDLLKEVARRLRDALPAGAVAARLGGDEFAVAYPSTGTEDGLAQATRVLREIEGPVRLHGMELDVRASAGVAVSPAHGDDPTVLLQRADVAMYVAKSAGGGALLYRQEDDQNTPRRLALASDLRRALAAEGLLVHYMPKADLQTGEVVGAEALVRWQHPEHGWVGPDEFVPVAEQAGLIGQLTRLVLSEALHQCSRWRRTGTPLTIAVNVSTRDLLDPALVDDVRDLLDATGVPADWLTLEITESSIMSDTGRASQVLHGLSALGVRLSVDDFGTGYSSLSYLQRLPVQELKVDKSFVFRIGVDPGDRALVRSIVELGHSLGLAVVAEGVEDRLSWDHLAALGCDVAQGYHLSRPLPASELSAWLTLASAAAAA